MKKRLCGIMWVLSVALGTGLMVAGCDFKAPDDPPIFAVAEAGDIAGIKQYQAQGNDMFIKNYFGENLIYPALVGHHFELVDYLLAEHLPLWTVDIRGMRISEYFTAKKDSEVLRWFISKGLDPNFYDRTQENELFGVATGGDVPSAQALLKIGFDPTKRNWRNQTPEQVAEEYHNTEVASFLRGFVGAKSAKVTAGQ